MERTLILIRHAHRDTANGRHLDNGLSEKGQRQAQRILEFYRSREWTTSEPVLVTSPKLRCVQTLEPLANWLGKPAQVDPEVGESSDTLLAARAWAKKWVELKSFQSSPLAIVCSHGDWIPECVHALTGSHIDISKGGWVELELHSHSQTQLTWLLQKLPKV